MPKTIDEQLAEYNETRYLNALTAMNNGTWKGTAPQFAKLSVAAGRTQGDVERDFAAIRSGRPLSSRPSPLRAIPPAAPAGYLAKRKPAPPPAAKLTSSFCAPRASHEQVRSFWSPTRSVLIKESLR